MIKSLTKVVPGVTRVRSGQTGNFGTIVKVYREALNESQFDAIDIEWDSNFTKSTSYMVFLILTEWIEII